MYQTDLLSIVKKNWLIYEDESQWYWIGIEVGIGIGIDFGIVSGSGIHVWFEFEFEARRSLPRFGGVKLLMDIPIFNSAVHWQLPISTEGTMGLKNF